MPRTTTSGGAKPLPHGLATAEAKPCPIGLLPNAEGAIWPSTSPAATILNVGFAPGVDEVAEGRPFVGKSGVLLRRWLEQAGLLGISGFANVELHRTRDLVCRYCKIDYWLYTGKFSEALARDLAFLAGKGKPTTKTQNALLVKWLAAVDCPHVWRETHGNREPRDPKTGECCGLPALAAMLRDPRWRIVLCWGAVPARRLAGYSGSVGSMVGRFRTLPTGQTCTVLNHPAYALRLRGSPAFAEVESVTREILRQVRDRIIFPENTGGYPYVTLRPPVVVLRGDEVVDIETRTILKDSPDPRTDPPTTLCIGDRDTQDVRLYPTPIEYEGHTASPVVTPEGSRFLVHNGQFDLPIIMGLAGHEGMDCDDTMVEAYLLGESVLSLKILARRHLGRHAREYKETSGDDAEYAAQDPHLTRDLHALFRPKISARGLDFLYEDVKIPLQRIMARHVRRGLLIDQARLKVLHDKMVERATILEANFKAITGHPDVNIRSNEQVADILFNELRLPPARAPRTREPIYTTNEVHIGQFMSVPAVAVLLSHRKAMAYLSRYTIPLSKMKRVSGLYDMTGTGTDRVSQVRRNCMNFPGLIKQCIEADAGGYFVYGDYSQIELRYAAFFSRDSYLLSVLREGRNMHEELCRAVYGARTPDTYTKAKSSNFAKLFGAGVKRRARTLGMPVSVVQRTEIPWPEWDAWVERRRLEPARTYWGYERNISDHIESSDEGLREKANREIINSIIQGSAGETTQYAQVLSDGAVTDLGGYVIHQEHDSVLAWLPFFVPPADGRRALEEMMLAAVPREIMDVIEVKVKVISGDHWG